MLVLVFFLVDLFIRDINLVLGGNGAKEIGTIAYKKRSATRRQASSYRWERLRNESPVYQGDTIRTADLSEASIVFDDQVELDVFENSLLTLLVVDGVSQLDFKQGTMSIAGNESGSGATRVIRSGSSVIELGSGDSASFTQTGSIVSMDVSAGQAVVTDQTGKKNRYRRESRGAFRFRDGGDNRRRTDDRNGRTRTKRAARMAGHRKKPGDVRSRRHRGKRRLGRRS